MKRSGLIATFLFSLACAMPAAAQTVTVTIKGVRSADGNVLANLCGDPAGPFPGKCLTYLSMAKAVEGDTTLSFDHVPDGRYAFQAFHDENGDFTHDMPDEGSAFSNAAAWPVTFDKAAFTVAGNTSIVATMVYLPKAE